MATVPDTHSMTALEHCFKVVVGDSDEHVGVFLEVNGLGLDWQTESYSEGGRNDFVYELRTRVKHPHLKLKSGVTNQSTLLDWVLGRGRLTGPQNMRIIFMTANGSILRTFAFIQAVPVRWTGPNGNVGANAVATETLEIAHRGLTPGI